MAFTETDRTKIRHALGFAAIFLQAEPILESAISSVQSVADGGTRPDNSTELQIKAWLVDIDTVETQLKKLWGKAIAVDVEGLKVDAARAMGVLRMEGRRLVNAISTALSTTPRRDVFSSAPPDDSGMPLSFGRWTV